jgi:hypothetical protein
MNKQEVSMKLFGVSTGETGQYGVGDIISGTMNDVSFGPDEKFLCDEPVYHIFFIDEDGIVIYVEEERNRI